MTIATAVSGTVTLGIATLAVIEPSIIAFAGVVVGAIVTIVTVVFAYKTAALGKKVAAQEERVKEQDVKIAEVIKTSDGMKDALVKATASESLARGVLSGMEQAEAKVAVKSAAAAEGRAQASQGGPLAQPSPLLPSQIQPIAAEGVEGVELTPEQIEKMIAELQEQAQKLRLKPVIQGTKEKPNDPP